MCGIYGIINKDPETLDYATFCCLGLANDLRGGDSCGIFFDGKTEYGIKETARLVSSPTSYQGKGTLSFSRGQMCNIW